MLLLHYLYIFPTCISSSCLWEVFPGKNHTRTPHPPACSLQPQVPVSLQWLAQRLLLGTHLVLIYLLLLSPCSLKVSLLPGVQNRAQRLCDKPYTHRSHPSNSRSCSPRGSGNSSSRSVEATRTQSHPCCLALALASPGAIAKSYSLWESIFL